MKILTEGNYKLTKATGYGWYYLHNLDDSEYPILKIYVPNIKIMEVKIW